MRPFRQLAWGERPAQAAPRRPGKRGDRPIAEQITRSTLRSTCGNSVQNQPLAGFRAHRSGTGGRLGRLVLLGRRPATPDQVMTVQPAFPPISSVTASTRDFARARFLIEDVYPSIEQGR